MAQTVIGQSGSGNSHMQLRMTYEAGNGSITVTKLEGCRTDGYDTVSYNSSSSSNYVIISIGGSNTTYEHVYQIAFSKNGNYTEFWSGSSSRSNISGGQTVRVTFSNTGNSNIENSVFSTYIDAGSAQDPAPYNVSINPYAEGRTSINLQRTWDRATYCEYNINNWGWISEYTTYPNGVYCGGNSVTNLTPNSTYSCQVRFGNGNSDLTYSNTAWCTTSGNAPSIRSVVTTPLITSCSFNISTSYDTNASYSSMRIDYGTSTSYGSHVNSTTISNLEAITRYYYKVSVTDNYGRTGTATGSFVTQDYDYKIRFKNNGTWKDAHTYIKVNGTWKKAIPEIKVNNQWKKGM